MLLLLHHPKKRPGTELASEQRLDKPSRSLFGASGHELEAVASTENHHEKGGFHSHRGTPKNHHLFLDGLFPEIHHPAMGIPPFMKPPYGYESKLGADKKKMINTQRKLKSVVPWVLTFDPFPYSYASK